MFRSYSAWLASLGLALLLLFEAPPLRAAGPEARLVAPDVFVLPGVLAEPAVRNGGRVVNTGFIIGPEGVVVIDSGASHAHGEAILAEVARHTAQPVRLLINTHPHPQNVLGNSAFAERGIPILASVRTRDMMAERCPRCFEAMTLATGAANMARTRVVLPDQLQSASATRRIAGRALRLLVPGHAHSEGDLAVLDIETGTLFSGDLVYRGQVPHMAESDLAGWIDALEQVRGEAFTILVPGRGEPGGRAELAAFAAYLRALQSSVGAAYADGRSPEEALEAAGQPAYAGWEGYAERHGRNVQHVYFDLERADLAGVGTRR